MHAELSFESRQIALELHALLQQLDPSRLTSSLYEQIHESSVNLRRRIEAVLRGEAIAGSANHLGPLRNQLSDIADIIAGAINRLAADNLIQERNATETSGLKLKSAQELRDEYLKLRETLQRHYQQLSQRLEEHRVAVPTLRPTNYKRSLLHATSGVLGAVLVEVFLTPTLALWIAIIFSSYAWATEFVRRRSPKFNERVMAFYGAVAHPHEHHRINSATWYCTALLILAVLFEMYQISIALAVLGLADPAAALIGRRWGKIKLINNRTLEGTLTFIVIGFIVSWIVLSIWHRGQFTYSQILVLSFAASFCGALGELFAGRIDDNILTPVTAAGGAYIASSILIL
ncbi:MAG: SEC59/DGK1/VTE5 family protein [Myxococcota bacterium]|nr:SEC59/DGK1/VTE5 family protein [Myxococcota bacterium]